MSENIIKTTVIADTASHKKAMVEAAQDTEKLGQAGKKAAGDLDGLSNELGNVSKSAQGLPDHLSGINNNLERMDRAAAGLPTRLAGIVAGFTALWGVQRGLSGADEIGQLQSRLEIATRSAEAGAEAYEKLMTVSDRTYKSIGNTAELYIRTSDSLAQMGYTAGQSLQMVEALSYGLTVSAADAQRSASVIDAWSKSLLMNKMGMEQYNTIVAYAPRLQQALAEALGTTNAGLLEMVRTGQLTADKLMLVNEQAEKMGIETDKMPVTMQDAAVRMDNAFKRISGSINSTLGVTEMLTGGMNTLSDNMEIVVGASVALSSVIAGRVVGSIVASTRESLASVVAARAKAAADLSAAQAAQVHAFAQVRATAGTVAATAATNALSAANARLAAAQTAAASTGMLRAGLAALGGPIGAVTVALGVAAAAWVTFGNKADKAATQAEQAAERVKQSLARLAQEEKYGAGDLGQARADAQTAYDELNKSGWLLLQT